MGPAPTLMHTMFRIFLVLVFGQTLLGPGALSAPSAVTVKNVRHHTHKTYTRIVLDLTGRVAIKETKNRKQATIALHNVRLSQRAQRTIKRKNFPRAIAVSQGRSNTVTLTLNVQALQTYKLLTLQKPNRVVVDLFYAKPSPSTVAKPKVPSSARRQRARPKTSPVTQPQAADSPSRTAAQKGKPASSPPVPSFPQNNKVFRVVIDPGHGGKDPGAVGRKGTKEKTINLQIAKHLRDLLQQRLHAKVLLTRSQDVFRDLEDRVAFANKQEADLFISIHVNSHPKKSVQGVEIYHFGKASDPRALEVAARENGMKLEDGAPPWQFIIADKLNDQKIEESRDFAWTTRNRLVTTLRKTYKIRDHGVKTAPFYVLRFTTIPGILAEVGFLSNPSEEKRLRNTTFQKKLAEGIYRGIHVYLKSRRPKSS